MLRLRPTLKKLVGWISWRRGIELVIAALLVDLCRSLNDGDTAIYHALRSLGFYTLGVVLGAGLVISVDRRKMSFRERFRLFRHQFLSRYII